MSIVVMRQIELEKSFHSDFVYDVQLPRGVDGRACDVIEVQMLDRTGTRFQLTYLEREGLMFGRYRLEMCYEGEACQLGQNADGDTFVLVRDHAGQLCGVMGIRPYAI